MTMPPAVKGAEEAGTAARVMASVAPPDRSLPTHKAEAVPGPFWHPPQGGNRPSHHRQDQQAEDGDPPVGHVLQPERGDQQAACAGGRDQQAAHARQQQHWHQRTQMTSPRVGGK